MRPPTAAALQRAGGEPQARHRDNAEEERARRMGYWTIFTFSRAAACVT